jgi:hypothetical protein
MHFLSVTAATNEQCHFPSGDGTPQNSSATGVSIASSLHPLSLQTQKPASTGLAASVCKMLLLELYRLAFARTDRRVETGRSSELLTKEGQAQMLSPLSDAVAGSGGEATTPQQDTMAVVACCRACLPPRAKHGVSGAVAPASDILDLALVPLSLLQPFWPLQLCLKWIANQVITAAAIGFSICESRSLARTYYAILQPKSVGGMSVENLCIISTRFKYQ